MKCYIEVSCKDVLYINQNLPTINLHTNNYFGDYIIADSIDDAVRLAINKISSMSQSLGLTSTVDYANECVTVYSGYVPFAEYFTFTVL